MAGALLEGKVVAEGIKESIRSEVGQLKKARGITPRLAAIQIGHNAASAIYIKAQQRTAEGLGIAYDLRALPEAIDRSSVADLIAELNANDSITAIILQLPVPQGIDAKALVSMIAPDKDAEGVHPFNLGRTMSGESGVGPCTAMAVMEMLAATQERLYGKEAVVVGHSAIVGKPLAMMLLSKFATTTVCHIATDERGALAEHVKRAEVLVAAVGKAGIIKGDWIRPGAIVIDIGINKVGERIVGDVEFDAAKERASFITPVPGGVGPLTTMILMRSVVELAKNRSGS